MKYHFISIGGCVMHSLAIYLKSKGNLVSGSDIIINDPSKTNLAKHNLLPNKLGWDTTKITKDIDYIILGYAASADNPELIMAESLKLKIITFPELVYDLTKEKKRIVISGCHGKSTISNMVKHILEDYFGDIDYLIGAKPVNKEMELFSIKANSTISIFEGDEQFCSKQQLIPKMQIYQPHIVVLTSLHWDHLQSYPTHEDYKNVFKSLIYSLNDKYGKLIINKDEPDIISFIKELDQEKINNIDVRYYSISDIEYIFDDKLQKIILHNKYIFQHFGKHNISNLCAAIKVAELFGISLDFCLNKIQTLGQIYKRLQLMNCPDIDEKHIYLDFAHAPSKIKGTIDALKEKHKNKKIIICFEPRTICSSFIEFQNLYIQFIKSCKLDHTDCIFIYSDPAIEYLTQNNIYLVKELQSIHPNCKILFFDNIDQLKKQIEITEFDAICFSSFSNFSSRIEELLSHSCLEQSKHSFNIFNTSNKFNNLLFIDHPEKLNNCIFASYQIIGGGTKTLLLSDNYIQPVLLNKLKGITYNDNMSILNVYSGESLDHIIHFISNYNISHDLDNLSGIPGQIGCAIVQNAGAYGTEIASFIINVNVYDLTTNEYITLSNQQCKFAYRESIFKTNPNYFIISVNLKINKDNQNNQRNNILNIRKTKFLIDATQSPTTWKYKNIGCLFQNTFFENKKINAGQIIETIQMELDMNNNKYFSFHPNHYNILILKDDITKIINIELFRNEFHSIVDNIKTKIFEKYNISLKLEVNYF